MPLIANLISNHWTKTVKYSEQHICKFIQIVLISIYAWPANWAANQLCLRRENLLLHYLVRDRPGGWFIYSYLLRYWFWIGIRIVDMHGFGVGDLWINSCRYSVQYQPKKRTKLPRVRYRNLANVCWNSEKLDSR